MTTTNLDNVVIRVLQVWEVPKLLSFRKKNDYSVLPGDKDADGESVIYSVLKYLWHGDRIVSLVAIREGEILGYVNLVFGKHRKFRGNAYLVNAAVQVSERGKGVGSLIFKKAEEYAKNRGSRRMELEVFATNTGAVKLYERLGYKIEGVKKRAVENSHDYDDLIFMAKFLTQ